MHISVRNLLSRRPLAQAVIRGSEKHPGLRAIVHFYAAPGGSLVTVEAQGLPEEEPFIAVHIHGGDSCTGNADDAFANAGAHLNFEMLGHPLHTGDFSALLNNDGYGWGAFFTNRFTPREVLGYPVIIHAHGDDYHTQPSGNAGEKIGCGIIRAV